MAGWATLAALRLRLGTGRSSSCCPQAPGAQARDWDAGYAGHDDADDDGSAGGAAAVTVVGNAQTRRQGPEAAEGQLPVPGQAGTVPVPVQGSTVAET